MPAIDNPITRSKNNMKKLTAILALYTCFSLSLCLNAQEQPKPLNLKTMPP